MKKILSIFNIILIILSSIWSCLFIWIHQPINITLAITLIIAWLALSFICIFKISLFNLNSIVFRIIYYIFFIIILFVFFSLVPSNNREWDPEVSKIATYQIKDGKVEVHNVRNFIWKNDYEHTTQWETRTYNINQIQSVDLVISHFIQGPIAHAFVTFGFENGEYLAFSIEVRREKNEKFSTIGGFFRQYELAIVIGDENDLIYTRSNVRNERVYIYPINMRKDQIQKLFLLYLNKANSLSEHPRWYNTWISNCTTIIFDLVEYTVGKDYIPRDYRVILPGLLPNYLYDIDQLDHKYTLDEWKKMAFLNPHILDFNSSLSEDNEDKNKFSKKIRSGWPN